MKKLLIASLLSMLAMTNANAAELLSTINPDNVASIVGIALDPVTGNLVIYGEFGGNTLRVLDQSGVELATLTSPGNNSNDYDLDYSTGPMMINGVSVPADTLLVFNGDDGPETLYAIDGSSAIIASVSLASASLVGGTHIPGTNNIATVDFTGNDFIRILSANDGSEVGFFNPGPQPFDIFYGDLDISATTGEITVVSSSQNIVRQLTQEGFCVRELDVDPFGIAGMSGVAIDEVSGNLWISSTNGNIYHLDPRPDVGDSDGDGLLDFDDNCIDQSNPNQFDSDGDGIGNACDADLTGVDGNDCIVNFLDLSVLANAFLSTPASPNWNPDADISGPLGVPDGIVNFLDFSRFSSSFLNPPGPSGRGNLCSCGL